jgi:hypothetical protein
MVMYYDMDGRAISQIIWGHLVMSPNKNVKESHVCDYNISTTYVGLSRDCIYQTLVTCPTYDDKYNGYVETHGQNVDPIERHKRIEAMLEAHMVSHSDR